MPAKTQREVAAICAYVAGTVNGNPPVTLRKAAAMCGKSHEWLRQHLVSAGLPLRPRGKSGPCPGRRKAKRYTLALVEYQSGTSLIESARKFGFTPHYLRAGITLRGRGRPRKEYMLGLSKFTVPWCTLATLSAATGAPEASASARLRDLRKAGYQVDKHSYHGRWLYRVHPRKAKGRKP